MSLRQKVQAVEEVFALLDLEIREFQGWTGLSCKAGCSKCCEKPDLEATILEFLPFAYQLFVAGEAWSWLDRLREHPSSVCVVYDPALTGGGCSRYLHRGLICRLFGYSGRRGKYGQSELVTCKVIKSEHPVVYEAAANQVRAGADIPLMNSYYMRLHAVDPDLMRYFFPVNEAIQRAIELVLHHFSYDDEGASAA